MLKINKKTITHSFDGYGNFKKIPEDQLPMFLSDEIKIAKGVKFKRIFDLCILHKELFNKIFYSSTRGFDIDMFIDEYNKVGEKESEITYLYVSRILSKWHKDYFDAYLNFGGIAENYTDEYNDEPYDCNMSVSFTPLYSLKNIEIRVDDAFIISGEKNETLFKDKKPITLFDFLSTILYEITWNGAPDNRNEKLEELNTTAQRIKNGEEELFELKEIDGEMYFVDKDGNKEKLGE